MLQNYTTVSQGVRQPFALKSNKGILVSLALISLTFAIYTAFLSGVLNFTTLTHNALPAPEASPASNEVPPGTFRTDSVASVVTKALYFRSLLTATQISTLQQTYTNSLARRWSNLPCGSGCRNGIQLATLTAAQLGAALEVIKAAAGTAANQGYDQFSQIRLAEEVLQATAGGNSYDSSIYFISFLNAPSTTTAWMLQYGGHHYAANIAFNLGKVVGTTPTFEGVEPRTFTINSVTYAPLNQEHDSLANMLAGLTATQLATSKLSGTFSDVTLAPGETNGGSGTFPATKLGLIASGLTTAQKNTIIAAIKTYTQDVDDSAGAVLQAVYANEIDATYIGWTGSGTSGNASTFLNANTNYVRIDGPSIWIEFVCQSGVVFPAQIHYHSVYRDHLRDYGSDLTATTLPLTMVSFKASMQGKSRLLSWRTTEEKNISHFEVERSADPVTGFASLGNVKANNATTNNYSFSDNETLSGSTYYYRLKLIDLDGNSRYSSVVSVKYIDNQMSISLFPNPAKNKLTISLPQSVTKATIKIINADGKTLISNSNQNGTILNIDIVKLPKGVYFVQLQSDQLTSTLKFLK